MRIRPTLALAALLALSACSAEPGVTVEDAGVRLPIVAGRPGAAYFTLRASRTPMTIVGVSSPQVQRIELHDMSMLDGVMRMGPLDDKSFPASGEFLFQQGGKHAMLFGISPDVKPGGTLRLVFDFDNAPDVAVAAPVEAIGG